MSKAGYVFKPYNELLPLETQSILSMPARFLYQCLWNKMAQREATVLNVIDHEAALKARCGIEFLPQAQAELVRAGLFHVEEVMSRSELALPRTQYTFVEPEDI